MQGQAKAQTLAVTLTPKKSPQMLGSLSLHFKTQGSLLGLSGVGQDLGVSTGYGSFRGMARLPHL